MTIETEAGKQGGLSDWRKVAWLILKGNDMDMKYPLNVCLIMSFHISLSLTFILHFHHKVTCTFISNLKLHLHVSTIIKENLKFLLTITFCRNMMEILHLITNT